MRSPLVVVLSTLLAASAADVAPSCGGCRGDRPLPRSAAPGEPCGGPFVCTAGTCAEVDDRPNGGMVEHACTTRCEDDAACEAFAPGKGLTCAGFVRGGGPAGFDASFARACLTKEGVARSRARAGSDAAAVTP